MTVNPFVMEHNFYSIAGLMQIVSLLLGVGLMVGGMFQFKRYGEMRTFMSHQMTLARPLMMVVAGVFCLYMPQIVGTALQSFWGTASPLVYSGSGNAFDSLVPPILTFVRIIGIASMIRGFMLFSRVGIVGHQPGTTGRALIHMLSGIFCVHILGSYHLMQQIAGIAS